MTITTTTSRWAYTGDGVNTIFTYTNRILTKEDLIVSVDGTVLTVDVGYTVSGVGEASGGSVVFTVAPSNGAAVVIVRDIKATQTTSLPLGGAFPSTAVEAALDKLTILVQQIESGDARRLRLQEADPAATINELPLKSDLAGNFLAFDDDGEPMAAAGTSASLGPVSAYIDTLLDDADSAAARATLEAAGLNVTNTFTESNVFDASSLRLQFTDDGELLGPSFSLRRLSASPAASDQLGRVIYEGQNSASEIIAYVRTRAVIVDPTDGAETGSYRVQTFNNGSLSDRFFVEEGAYLTGATGNDMGAGSINASQYFLNGIRHSPWIYGSQVATTSGTSVTLSSAIPDWATDIEVLLNGVSVNTNSIVPTIRAGAGGVETTGYSCAISLHTSGGAVTQNITDGFALTHTSNWGASEALTGIAKLNRWDRSEDLWLFESSAFQSSTPERSEGNGFRSFGSGIDTITLVISSGAFDAGEARIRYR